MDISNLNFLDMATIVSDEELTNRNNEQTIRSCNENGHIPLRFSNCRFTDFTKPCTKQIRDFCLEAKSDKICILSGPCGNGKTYLCCSAMHERAVTGLAAGLYLSCRTLKPRIKSTYAYSSPVSEMDIYESCAKTPFLVLDEVGKCTDAQLEWEFITTVIAMRYDNQLPMMMTTNMTFEQFRAFIIGSNGRGDDIFDRINSVVLPFSFSEQSWR